MSRFEPHPELAGEQTARIDIVLGPGRVARKPCRAKLSRAIPDVDMLPCDIENSK